MNRRLINLVVPSRCCVRTSPSGRAQADGAPPGERVSHRKLRLFVFACVRRHWHLLRDERLRRAVETGELHADGRADDRELGRAVTEANRARRKGSPLCRAAYDAARYKTSDGVHWDSVSMYCAYAAANSAVPDVPPSAYAFDRLLELSGALTRARCEDPAVLGHCRSPGLHVRGCWEIDRILGSA